MVAAAKKGCTRLAELVEAAATMAVGSEGSCNLFRAAQDSTPRWVEVLATAAVTWVKGCSLPRLPAVQWAMVG